jgi:hypothetical protein
VPIFLKSGSLNLLEHLGPLQACNGITLPLPLLYIKTNTHFNRISLSSGYNEICFRQIYRENQTTLLTFSNFFHLWDKVEKYGRARQATDDNTTQGMRFVCWVKEATDIYSEHVIIISFAR